MAENDLKIKIKAVFEDKGAKDAKKSLEGIAKEADSATKEVKELDKSFGGLKNNVDFLAHASQAVSGFVRGLGVATGAITNFISTGLELNQNYQDLTHRLQSLVNAANKSNNITPLEKWNKSGDIAKGLIDDLKRLDTQLDFSLSDLSSMFVNFYAGASGHLKSDEIVAAFTKIAHAAQASGADIGSMKVTLDSLGAGIVDKQTDLGMFLNSIGLNTQKLTQAIKDNNFLEVLEEHLGAFEKTSEFSEKKFGAVVSSFQSGMDSIKQAAMKPLFDQLITSFDELGKYIGENGDEIKEDMANLGEALGDISKELLTKENLHGAIEGFIGLSKAIKGVVGIVGELNDLVVPDWLVGVKDGGVGAALKTSVRGYKNLFASLEALDSEVSGLFTQSNSKILKQFEDEAKNSLAQIGEFAFLVGAKFDGVGFDTSNLNANVVASEIAKVDEQLAVLQTRLSQTQNATLLGFHAQQWGKTEAAIENSIFALSRYKKQLEESKGVKIDVDVEVSEEELSKKAQELNKKALDEFLKSYEKRGKEHEKTIERLVSQEKRLTKELIDGEAKRAEISFNAEQKRAGLKLSASEKLRALNQEGKSELEIYADNLKTYNDSVARARDALSAGSMQEYERYVNLAKSLNDTLANDTKDSNQKGRIEELLALELSGVDAKEKAELALHDAKMSSIKTELEAVRTKIELEMSFYNELNALQNAFKSGEIDFSVNGFEETRAKIEQIDALIAKTKPAHKVFTQAVQELEMLKARTLELNGVSLEVKADTTPADFGIKKLISEVDKSGEVNIRVNPEFEEAKAKIDAFNEDSAILSVDADPSLAENKIKSLEVPTSSLHTISADDRAVKDAINGLLKNTSSVHTIYVQKVEPHSTGGVVGEVSRYANGGAVFKRKKQKIAGHDLSGSDDVPAMLTRGEYVHNVKAVDHYGVAFMNALNARKIPKEILSLPSFNVTAKPSGGGGLAKFARGGLVLNRQNQSPISATFNKKFMQINEEEIQKYAKELKEKFDMQVRVAKSTGAIGETTAKRLVIKSWQEKYPKFFKATHGSMSWDFLGLAKELLDGKANSVMGGWQGMELPKFSTGGSVSGIKEQGVKNSKNINLNFNLGGGLSASVLSDEASAAAIERYFKGLGA